jgi:hypothetical protein
MIATGKSDYRTSALAPLRATPRRDPAGSKSLTSQTNRVGRSISSHPTGPLNATRETQRPAQVSIRSIWSDLAPTGTRLVSCTESSSRSSSSQLLRHQPVAAIQTAGAVEGLPRRRTGIRHLVPHRQEPCSRGRSSPPPSHRVQRTKRSRVLGSGTLPGKIRDLATTLTSGGK